MDNTADSMTVTDEARDWLDAYNRKIQRWEEITGLDHQTYLYASLLHEQIFGLDGREVM